MADRQSPTPGEITIMAAGAVMLIFSFLHFAGNNQRLGQPPVPDRDPPCRCTAW